MAKKILATLATVMIVATANAQPPDTLWTRTLGGAGNDVGYSVQQTGDGGYIVAGYTMSYGAGGPDVYLVKTDSSGIEQWSQTFGGSAMDKGSSVQQTSDGGYIIAGYTWSYGAGAADFYLIKTDASGIEEWTQTFGGSLSDCGYSVQQTNDGGFVITGQTDNYGAGDADIYLVKTDSSGIEQWSQTFGGSDGECGQSVQQTDDGGYIIAGITHSYGSGNGDVYLVKADSSGTKQWDQTFGGSSMDFGNSVRQTSDGGYIIAGFTMSFGAGSYDVYLIKTDASGNQQWSQTFGGSGGEWGCGVQQTDDGGYIIVGNTPSFGAGSDDVYVVKTDSSGVELWSQTFGGSSLDQSCSVQLTGDGGFIVAGYTDSFGAGSGDCWLIRLEAETEMLTIPPQSAFPESSMQKGGRLRP